MYAKRRIRSAIRITRGGSRARRDMLPALACRWAVLVASSHHDPWSTDDKLRRMYANAVRYMHAQLPNYLSDWDPVQPGGPRLMMAHDGLTVEL